MMHISLAITVVVCALTSTVFAGKIRNQWSSIEETRSLVNTPSEKRAIESSKLSELLLLLENEVAKRMTCGVTSTMTTSEQTTIVSLHNAARAFGQTGAAGMLEMEWDSGLADRAQEWADQCLWKHGLTKMCDGSRIGQNNALGIGTTQTELVGGWTSEKQYYTLADNSCQSGKVCGHYTQIVWESSYKVGCGFKTCASIEVSGNTWYNADILVCDYSPAGNFNGNSPYAAGGECSQCDRVFPSSSRALCTTDGFCEECTGSSGGCSCVNNGNCQYGGTFDEPSCTCSCTADYTGDNCETCVNVVECQNGGTYDHDICACRCATGFLGVFCQVDTSVDTSGYINVESSCASWIVHCFNPLYIAFMTTNCQKACLCEVVPTDAVCST